MNSGRGGPYATLIVLTFVSLLTMYVEAMVIPSLPKIESILSASSEQAAWIVSSYLVVGAAVAPLFGKLGDVYGKKKLYLASLSVYTLAVLLAGFSPNVYFLIAIRAVQGARWYAVISQAPFQEETDKGILEILEMAAKIESES